MGRINDELTTFADNTIRAFAGWYGLRTCDSTGLFDVITDTLGCRSAGYGDPFDMIFGHVCTPEGLDEVANFARGMFRDSQDELFDLLAGRHDAAEAERLMECNAACARVLASPLLREL